ncbi:helix-turn-helix transcriptional regulator [Actinopolymorpha sp. B11F2]|uniref:helix-turn-helix transcriptional regulator n=1 Tax=Actinopolymorpha sp. B11F2 TaxID=3160862 RepID=UPI0032E50CC5
MTCRVVVRIGPEVAHYPPGATFGPRTLVDYEFVWLLAGSARWTCDEPDSTRPEPPTHRHLRPGTLLLARPGMRDHFAWDPTRASLHAFVHFRVVEADLDTLGPPETWPISRALTPADPLAALCRYSLWLGRGRARGTQPGTTRTGQNDRTTDVLGFLLDLFVRGPVPADDEGDEIHPYLARLADHLRRTWRGGGTTPLALTEMAAAAGISTGHLSRLFRAEYGIGPVAAIELVRLARSATLLQRSNLTVGAVASACGFANPFHFSRRFRAVYGVPPRTYRTDRGSDDPLAPLTPAGLLPIAHRLLVDDA